MKNQKHILTSPVFLGRSGGQSKRTRSRKKLNEKKAIKTGFHVRRLKGPAGGKVAGEEKKPTRDHAKRKVQKDKEELYKIRSCSTKVRPSSEQRSPKCRRKKEKEGSQNWLD